MEGEYVQPCGISQLIYGCSRAGLACKRSWFDPRPGQNVNSIFSLVTYVCTNAGPVNCGLCLLHENYSMHRLPIYKFITYMYTYSGYTYKISEKYT